MGNMIRLKAADGHELDAYVAEPTGKPKGGIVVVQEIFGVTNHVQRVADQYAAAGYKAIAPAMFDRIKRGITLDYTEIQQGIAYMLQLKWPNTLADLEELGSSPAFMDKLIGVFVADNVTLIAKMETALAARNVAEFRGHLHALKGSAASMGAERLTACCKAFGQLSDSEVKLQIPALLRTLREDVAMTRESLERYLQERKKLTG